VFEKRVLGRIFASGKDVVTEAWRKSFNEYLYNLHSS
jgi:hypothetical protein